MQFSFVSPSETFKTGILEKLPATNITPFTLVTLDANGRAVTATATSTVLWACIAVWDNWVKIVDKEIPLKMVSDVPYNRVYRNQEVDLAIQWSNQVVDLDESTTDVFVVLWTSNTSTIWENEVIVKINKGIEIL